ncbi:hypothethical protein (plasmid) [Ralstonia solanacearum CMR15]|nr:hypothethical protein [Ralstonia solanacearum CMR15]
MQLQKRLRELEVENWALFHLK